MSKNKSLRRTSFLVLLSLFIGAIVFLFTSPSGVRFKIFERKMLLSPIVSGQKTTESPTTKIPPTSISIQKLDISLPISAALVHDNEWDIFEDKVSWLSTSAVPGEGNVILYAHDRPEMFGELYKLEKGDIIEIEQDKITVSYKVTESRSVQPQDVEAILSDDNQLTLYTCEGSFDQKRLVVYADPL
jgi:LPXTG-site transpeptidase (sortase) family protein